MSHPIDEQTWHRMTEEIMAGMRDWRLPHPKATLREMEPNSIRRWARVRARMLEDWRWRVPPPIGPQHRRSAADLPRLRTAVATARHRHTHAPNPRRRSVTWSASTAVAQPVALGFSPLDEELGLLPGKLTPRLQEALVRLSTHIPSFAKAARELTWFTGAQVHPDTVRQRTEAAGTVLVAFETTEAARILREHPAPPCTPDTLVISVDGAMIPLVHGQWTEVRTLAVGEVQPSQATADGPVVHTTNLSYFSRRTDSTTFADLATLELHRRGLEGARRVGAVVDGAVWCQSFIDLHYPEAVRILDFAHAAEYLTAIAQTTGVDGPLLSPARLAELRHALKHAGPAAVMPQVRRCVATQPTNADLANSLAYLETRLAQLQYPQFLADGWPIGSGMVESANKLVVEDRLKGAGMHWAEASVNPLLALRNAICNDRWAECWGVIEREQRRQVAVRRQARSRPRAAARVAQAQLSQVAPKAPVHQLVRPLEAEVKPPHPWTRAWSIRRQRELAGLG